MYRLITLYGVIWHVPTFVPWSRHSIPEERSTHLSWPWSCRGELPLAQLSTRLVGLLDYIIWWGRGDSAPVVYRKLLSRFWLGKRHWTPLIEISLSRYKCKSSKFWLWGAKDSDLFAIFILSFEVLYFFIFYFWHLTLIFAIIIIFFFGKVLGECVYVLHSRAFHTYSFFCIFFLNHWRCHLSKLGMDAQ